jgi:hypothetical protein
MSSVYGYAQSLSEGSSFNARVQAHNDLVNEHNNKVLADFDLAVKQQKRDKADDKGQLKEDAAITGTEDGKGLLMNAYGAYKFGQAIANEGGVVAAFSKAAAERQGAISSTINRITQGAKPPVNAGVELGEATQDGKYITSAGQEASLVAKDASAAASGAAEAGGEIGSSGLGAAIVKGTLGKLGAGKVLGEAGLSAVSEIGGKVIGDFGGLVDVGEGFANLAQNKNFFGNDDTAEKWGDSFQMAGAALDVVGTAFPPLELLGGAVGLVGGLINTVDSLSKDEDKKQSDAAPITDPNQDPLKAGIQKLQISPAFQSLGLVASAPISAKSAITGASGAF